MKKVLIILGHPSKQSLSKKIAEAYAKGAKSANAEVKLLNLANLNFDPVLHEGYKQNQELEPDLIKSQKLISWADHLVFVYPVWWGSMPALLQGFIERVFLPGYAYKFRKDKLLSFLPDGLLKGKTARIITTSGGNWLVYFGLRNPSLTALKYFTLKFCGVSNIKTTEFNSIRKSTPESKIKKILQKCESLGKTLS